MAQINLSLDIESLEIISQTLDTKGDIVIEVASKNDHSTCHKCGKPTTKRDEKAPPRLIRHLPLFNTPVYLKITPIRYSCEYCDDHPTTTEQYDWCARNASTTKKLEDYLMLCLINSTVEYVAKKINRWIKAVEKSVLNKHKLYIGNYFKARKSSELVEGLNNKIKALKRRCYGIFKTETLFQRLFLDLQGFKGYA